MTAWSACLSTAKGASRRSDLVRAGPPQDVPSEKISEEIRSSSCASAASIGNNRAKAISENEPNYEPDCESDCEVRHHITIHRPDRTSPAIVLRQEPLRGDQVAEASLPSSPPEMPWRPMMHSKPQALRAASSWLANSRSSRL